MSTSVPSTGFTTTLVSCLAQHLEDQGVANWDPDGTYAKTDTGIWLKTIPSAAGDKAYALSFYLVDDEPTDPDDGAWVSLGGLQVRSRGTKDPVVADDLDDEVFCVLHGARGLLLGQGPAAIHVALIHRQSRADLGADDLGRFEVTSNYYLQLSRPMATTA